jgi:Na+-translocating ferredoxin:NAD+ oxidoreductase RnfG subunit
MERRILLTAVFLIATPLLAHITPPRTLLSEADAARQLLPEAQTFSRLDVKLSAAQKQEVKKAANWNPDQKVYRAYIGRDTQGRYRGAVLFVGEITLHGLVKLAVAVDAEDKIKGARVVSITDEAYGWVKPLVDQNFDRRFVGKDHRSVFGETARATAKRGAMPEFYDQVLANLVQRAAVICNVTNVAKAATP